MGEVSEPSAVRVRMPHRALRLTLATAGLVLGGALLGAAGSASAAEPAPDSLLGAVTSAVTETVQAVPVVSSIVAPAPAPAPAAPAPAAPAPTPAAAPAPAPARGAPVRAIVAPVVTALPSAVSAPASAVTAPVDAAVGLTTGTVSGVVAPVAGGVTDAVRPVVDLLDGVVAGLPLVGSITGQTPLGDVVDVVGSVGQGVVTGLEPHAGPGSSSAAGVSVVTSEAPVTFVGSTGEGMPIDRERGAHRASAATPPGGAGASAASVAAAPANGPALPALPIGPGSPAPASGSVTVQAGTIIPVADLSERPVFTVPSFRVGGSERGHRVSSLSADPGSSPD